MKNKNSSSTSGHEYGLIQKFSILNLIRILCRFKHFCNIINQSKYIPVKSVSFNFEGSGSNPIQCCDSNGLPLPASTSHSQCFPIEIPIDDLFYSRHNQRCMNFVRSLPAPSIDCKLGPRNQVNIHSLYFSLLQIFSSVSKSVNGVTLTL